MRDSDIGLHRFRKTNLFHTNNPYYLFQDPTVLGFKLFFHFDSKLLSEASNNDDMNTALNFLQRNGEIERAKLLKKFINHLRRINNETPWFFQSIEGLDDAWRHGLGKSSEDFSPRVPDDAMIKIKTLESVDLRMTTLMDLYRKACFDWEFRREVVPANLRKFKISIYIYELRNFNLSGLPIGSNFINLDKNLLQQKQNEILFTGKSIINETESYDKLTDVLRNSVGQVIKTASDSIKTRINALKDKFSNNKQIDDTKEESNKIDVNINRILFEFDYCEWLPDESAEFLSDINNSQGEYIEQCIAFNYQNVREHNINNIYGIKDNDNNSLLTDALISQMDVASITNFNLSNDDLINAGNINNITNDSNNNKTFPMGLINEYAKYATESTNKYIDNRLDRLLLGNIYGIKPDQLTSSISGLLHGEGDLISNTRDVLNQTNSAIGIIKNTISKNKVTSTIKNSKSVYGKINYIEPKDSKYDNIYKR